MTELSLRSKRFRLVSEHRKTEELYCRFWPREKWNKSQKNQSGGRGKGRKETLAEKPLDFENLQRLIGSASQTMLTPVDQMFVP